MHSPEVVDMLRTVCGELNGSERSCTLSEVVENAHIRLLATFSRRGGRRFKSCHSDQQLVRFQNELAPGSAPGSRTSGQFRGQFRTHFIPDAFACCPAKVIGRSGKMGKKKRGRPATGQGVPIQVRVHTELLKNIDVWIRSNQHTSSAVH